MVFLVEWYRKKKSNKCCLTHQTLQCLYGTELTARLHLHSNTLDLLFHGNTQGVNDYLKGYRKETCHNFDEVKSEKQVFTILGRPHDQHETEGKGALILSLSFIHGFPVSLQGFTSKF